MADKIVSWGGIDSKGTTGMGVTGSLSVSGSMTTNADIALNSTSSRTSILGFYGSSGVQGTLGSSYHTLAVTGSNNFVWSAFSAGGYSTTPLTLSGGSNWSIPGNMKIGTITTSGIGSNGSYGGNYATLTITGGGYNDGTNPSINFITWDGGNTTSRFQIHSRTLGGGNGKIVAVPDNGNFIIGASTDLSAKLAVRGSGTTSSTTALLVQNANTSSSLVVLDNNYVGIGKSPSYPLDVAITNGGNANSGMFVSGVHPDGRALLYGKANTNTEQMLYWWHSGGIGVGTGGSARGGAVSYIGDTSYYGPAHVMHFMETGTTFGPTNVKSRLSISTTTTDTALFSQVSNNSTNIESNTFSFTAKSHTFYTGTTTGNQSYPNQFTPLHLSTSGSVGINTITPSATLDVSGSGRFTSNVTITGSLTVSGSITATVPTTSSYVCDGILSSNQIFATGSDVTIAFVDYVDPNGWLTSNQFKPTIAGYYSVSFGVWLQNPGVASNQVNAQMRKNTDAMIISQQPLNNGTGISLGGSRIVQMNGTTDYLDWTVFQGTVGSGTTGTLLQGSANGSGTWFSAFLLTQ